LLETWDDAAVDAMADNAWDARGAGEDEGDAWIRVRSDAAELSREMDEAN
jgi:hypothetical protein